LHGGERELFNVLVAVKQCQRNRDEAFLMLGERWVFFTFAHCPKV
jgi:hypothetical protein